MDSAIKEKLLAVPEMKLGLACVETATQICRHLGIGFKAPAKDLDLSTFEGVKILDLNPEKLKAVIEQGQKIYSQEKAIFS